MPRRHRRQALTEAFAKTRGMLSDPILALQWALDQLSPADLVASADALNSLHGFLARGTRVQRRRILGEQSSHTTTPPTQKQARSHPGLNSSSSCHCRSGIRKRKRLHEETRASASCSSDSASPADSAVPQSPPSSTYHASPSSWGSPESTTSFLPQLNTATSSPWLPPDSPPENRPSPDQPTTLQPAPSSPTPTAILSTARHFFSTHLGPRSSRAPNLLRALQGFIESAPPAPDFADTIWRATGSIFGDQPPDHHQSAIPTPPGSAPLGSAASPTRLQRLYAGHRRVKDGREKFACAARFCHIYLDHDLEQLLADPQRERELVLSQGRGRVTAGLEVQAASICATVEQVKAERKAGRNYARLLGMAGPGWVLRVGGGVSTVWERKLSKSDLQLVLDFMRSQMPELAQKIEACNGIAARALLNGLLAYGWTREEILETNSTLFDILKRHTSVADEGSPSEATIPSSIASSSPSRDTSTEYSVGGTNITPFSPDSLFGGNAFEEPLPATDLLECGLAEKPNGHDAELELRDLQLPLPIGEDSLSPFKYGHDDQEAEMLLDTLDDIFSFDFGR